MLEAPQRLRTAAVSTTLRTISAGSGFSYFALTGSQMELDAFGFETLSESRLATSASSRLQIYRCDEAIVSTFLGGELTEVATV